MESDIILEVFNEAESKFGLRYLKMIGDGDSSVLDTLIKNGSCWCRDLKKIECANYCCKCIRTVLDNLDIKGRNGLTKVKRVQMVSAIRFCIKMRTNEFKSGFTCRAVRNLQNDINLMPFHIFGYHENCSPSFCKTIKAKEVTEVQYDNFERVDDETFNNQDDAVTVSNVLNETYQFSIEGMSVGVEENSRISGPPVTLNKDLMLQLNIIMNRQEILNQEANGIFFQNLCKKV